MKNEDILSYRPSIKYQKENKRITPDLNSDIGNSNTTNEYITNENSLTYNSVILQDIKENFPSNIYLDIEDVINNIKDYISNIENEANNKKQNQIKVNEYLSRIKNKEITSYKDIPEVIKDENQNSTIEVYSELSSELEYLEEIKKVFLAINYLVEEADVSKLESIDNITFTKLLEYENNKDGHVNYFNLSIDTKVNMLLKGYIEAVHMYTQNLYYLIYMDRKHEAKNDPKIKKGLEETFKDLSKYNLLDLSKLTKAKNNGNISKILKHINNTKVNACYMLDAMYELGANPDDYAIYVENVFLKKSKEIDNMIIDLFKEISLLSSYRDDYLDTLTQKEYLRKIFLKF